MATTPVNRCLVWMRRFLFCWCYHNSRDEKVHSIAISSMKETSSSHGDAEHPRITFKASVERVSKYRGGGDSAEDAQIARLLESHLSSGVLPGVPAAYKTTIITSSPIPRRPTILPSVQEDDHVLDSQEERRSFLQSEDASKRLSVSFSQSSIHAVESQGDSEGPRSLRVMKVEELATIKSVAETSSPRTGGLKKTMSSVEGVEPSPRSEGKLLRGKVYSEAWATPSSDAEEDKRIAKVCGLPEPQPNPVLQEEEPKPPAEAWKEV